METHVDATFIFALTWSLGGSAGSNEARILFDTFLRVAYECILQGHALNGELKMANS
mgnify:CR=1 FL=1